MRWWIGLLSLWLLAACRGGSDQIAPLPSIADPAALTTVQVFFTPINQPLPTKPTAVERPVMAAPDPEAQLAAAIKQQLAGPTDAERERGLTSWFSSATAGTLNGVEIDQDGAAFVDFANFSRTIAGASTSAGSVMLFTELNSTVFQFDQITSVTYAFDGSCAVFGEWTQVAGCLNYKREQWKAWINR